MRTLMFAEYSDDTFGLINDSQDDFDCYANGEPIFCRVKSGKESVLVVGQYAPKSLSGGWLVGICPDEIGMEEVPVPAWPVRLRAPASGDSSYSPVLEIAVPDDATVEFFQT